MKVDAPLHFVSCTLTQAPRFDGADLHELCITNGQFAPSVPEVVLGASELPGLLANGVRIRRDLSLSGSRIIGEHRVTASVSRSSAVWLTEAEVGGRLLAVGTHIESTGDRAMQCDRTRVAGDVRLIRGFRADGEIRLLKAQLDGALDLRGARITAKRGQALDLVEAQLGTLFILEDDNVEGDGARASITGRIDMSGATVHGHVYIRNARLIGPAAGVELHEYNAEESAARTTILARRLTVHDDWLVEGRTEIEGGLDLHGADIKGAFQMKGVVIDNAEDVAVDLAQAQLGSQFNMNGARVRGTIKLALANVGGSLALSGAILDAPKQEPSSPEGQPTLRCLEAIGVQVAGDIWFGGLQATGGRLDLRSATIGGVVFAEGATLTNPGHRTLNLHHARVAGTVRLRGGLTSVGRIVLNRAVIDGRLRCDGATLELGPDANADAGKPPDSVFEAISTTVRSGISLGWNLPTGAVDFTDARTSYLADDPSRNWPEYANLGGFVYERFAPLASNFGNGVSDAESRIAWLRRLKPYDPLPWEQVARVLRTQGDVRGAEKVLIVQRRRARREGAKWWRRPFGVLADICVGYGYRPERAPALLVLLVVGVYVMLLTPWARASMTAVSPAFVASLDGPSQPTAACGAGRVRCLEPFFYAVDTVVPLIDLGQRAAWYPSGPDGRLVALILNVCTIFGWLASTVFVFSITRFVRSRS